MRDLERVYVDVLHYVRWARRPPMFLAVEYTWLVTERLPGWRRHRLAVVAARNLAVDGNMEEILDVVGDMLRARLAMMPQDEHLLEQRLGG